MAVHVVIPARMASTRLPNKPLADIAGVPMVVRVAERASRAKVDSVVVAVDVAETADVVAAAGYEAMLTAADHPSGSDRVMEVAQRKSWPAADVVINVQGDEPLIPPEIIDQLAAEMNADTATELATLSEPISNSEDFLNPNIVKVVSTDTQQALYFSRAPIPYPRDELYNSDGAALTAMQIQALDPRRHVGIYAFRVAALRDFVKLNNARLEQIERLEQLRWLQAGRAIKVLPCAVPIPGGVDTPEDLLRVTQLILAQGQ